MGVRNREPSSRRAMESGRLGGAHEEPTKSAVGSGRGRCRKTTRRGIGKRSANSKGSEEQNRAVAACGWC